MTPADLRKSRDELCRLLGVESSQRVMWEELHVCRRTYQNWECESKAFPIPEWVPELVRLKIMERKLIMKLSERQRKEIMG